MADDTLIFDGNKSMNEINLENDLDPMNIAADGDHENELSEEHVPPEDPEDDEFKLNGYDDLHIDHDPEDSGQNQDDESADDHEVKYKRTVTGKKRKRASSSRSSRRNLLLATSKDVEPFILEEDTRFATKQSSRIPGTWGRSDRKKGESLAAYHKRISHDLDSDDELLMDMREKGFSDRQIADKLAKDGRVRYDYKSISTRIMRIRLAQAQNVDFLLKEGYKEWEYHDDCLLLQAHALADIEINYEIERARAWRFRKVSENMRRLNKDALFSETACRERYCALMNGTARIPTDLDDDPDARRAEMEAYRESRERMRIKEKKREEVRGKQDRKAKDEAKTRNAQKAEETARKRAAKENEKAQRAMQRAAAAQVRAQRASENSTAKAQRNAQIKRQKTTTENNMKQKDKAIKSKRTTNATATPDNITPSTPKPEEEKGEQEETNKRPDPRTLISHDDLIKMCSSRGLQIHAKSKDQLLDAIRDADNEWSLSDLKKMCRTKGLRSTGNKASLQYALAMAAVQGCASYGSGVDCAVGGDGDEGC